jgi:hypothetical protein
VSFAEELDVTAEDIAVTLEAPEEGHGLELKDTASFAADGADVVTVDGNSAAVADAVVAFFTDPNERGTSVNVPHRLITHKL